MNRAKSRGAAFLSAAALAVAISGCQTKPPPPPAERVAAVEAPAPEVLSDAKPSAAPEARAPDATARDPSVIKADGEGFWPSPESRSREISFSILIGDAKFLRSWRVEIASAVDPGIARTYSGGAYDSPETLAWDGRESDGTPSPEGYYVATLTADYAGGLARQTQRSSPFALALSPPEPLLLADPQRIDPSRGGLGRGVSFELVGRAALARLGSWRLDVVGPDGRLFRAFEGAWPAEGSPDKVAWDGLSGADAAVEAGKRYSAILTVRDVYGHAASAQAGIEVADLPFAAERSSVRPWTNGFSPNGDKVMDAMDLSLGFGQRSAVRSWRLDIGQAGKGPARGFRGEAPDLPDALSWDGKDSTGAAAPEGSYFATLYVDYGSAFSPAVARSPSFVLDVTPPALALEVSPAPFSPDASGSEAGEGPSALSIRLGAPGEGPGLPSRISEWSIEILDPGDQVFARFGGAWPPAAIAWDGVGSDGSLVESAETYRVVARARDELGNSSRAEGAFDTDILVVKDGDRYRVAVSSIVFKGYTADYEDLPAEQLAQNRQTLDRLAAKFAKFPGYRIRLVGHAVMINWDDPNLGRGEQERILLPLSRSRAAAIAKALAARGIAASRMIVEGVGASRPLVPDSDLANRWKNRRVEFFLEK